MTRRNPAFQNYVTHLFGGGGGRVLCKLTRTNLPVVNRARCCCLQTNGGFSPFRFPERRQATPQKISSPTPTHLWQRRERRCALFGYAGKKFNVPPSLFALPPSHPRPDTPPRGRGSFPPTCMLLSRFGRRIIRSLFLSGSISTYRTSIKRFYFSMYIFNVIRGTDFCKI